ncbi:MAG: hypothetical protein V7K94_31810 [Nostoc sp.]|uniref:hypothetical protein n=1 Tax=Nostoc sp. TaxID=1180 RepID=UPI002FF4E9E7
MLIPNKALNPATTTGADNTTVNSGNNANTATKIRKTIGVAIPAAFAASTIKAHQRIESAFDVFSVGK